MRGILILTALALCVAYVPVAAADPVEDLEDQCRPFCTTVMETIEEGPEPTGCRPLCLDDLT